ncbi:class I SAM-dependent methyltransferase [Nitrospinae bacterium AH-259-F20]|nr:class I SAM-dependent methyltransferase [Nitrospinae bacterium AH-259-F20]
MAYKGVIIVNADGVPFKFLEEYSVAVALWRTHEIRALSDVTLEEPLLDLGCGDGLVTSILVDRPVGVGLDLAASHLNRAKARANYRGLVKGDSSALAFFDESFKTVFSNSVLEHVEPLDETLGEVVRVLEPGGRLIMTVPNPAFGDWLLVRNFLEALGLASLGRWSAQWVNSKFAHLHVLSLEEWQEKLRKVGLHVVLHRYYVDKRSHRLFELLLPSRWLSAKIERILGRPGLLPRRLVKYLHGPWIGRAASVCEEEGSGLLLVAEKG